MQILFWLSEPPRPRGKPHAGGCECWKQASSLERRPAGAGLVMSWFFLDKEETVSLPLVSLPVPVVGQQRS